MRNRNLRIPLLYQYLISYLFVLMIPLIITGAIVYTQFISLTRDRELQGNENEVNQIQEVVDSQFSNFVAISLQLSHVSGLNSNQFDANNIIQIRNLLNFSVSNPFIPEVTYFKRNSDFMFSARTTYRPELFHDMYIDSSMDNASFQRMLNELNKPRILSTHVNGQKNLLYLSPVPINEGTPYGTAIFMLDTDALYKQFRSLLQYDDSNSFIFDQDGSVLFSLNENQSFVNDEFSKQGKATASYEKKMNGKSYLISSKKSEITGLTYMTVVPKDKVLEPVNRLIQKAVAAAAMIMLIGFAIIFLSMRYNYNPIRKIISIADAYLGPSQDRRHGIEKLTAVMAHAETINKTLQSQTEQLGPALREHLISNLLRGRIKDIGSFNELGESVHVQLKGSRYFVLVMSFTFNSLEISSLSITNLMKQWGKHLNEDIERLEAEMLEDGMGGLIVCADRLVELSEIRWNEIHHAFLSETGVPVTVGIGQTYDLNEDISLLSKSYMEGITALQYKVIKGSNCVIHFSETAGTIPSIDWYPTREIELLELSIRDRQIDKIVTVSSELVQLIEKHSTSLYMAKYLSIQVVNSFVNTVNLLSEWSIKNKEFPDVISISQIDSMQALSNMVMQVCETIVDELLLGSGKSVEETKIQSILDYLTHHALDYRFSVQQMAEDLEISKVHIGRLLKEHTSMTITDHVNKLRMERAKLLLKTKEDSIQEIVEQIGYTDVSSFIRKFKQEVGITPGEYRKLARQ